MKRPLLLPLLSLWLLSAPARAQIHGRVFSDHNANGRLDQPIETGVARVEVSLYDRLGQPVASARTDSAGYYRFPRLTAQPLRLQFTSLPADHYPTGAFRLVRFVQQADEVADLGVYQPTLFMGDQAKLAISIQPLGNHGDKRSDSLGITAVQLLPVGGRAGTDTTLRVKPALVGSVWGLAHDAYRGRLYAAALAKRHSGFGPLGAGGIYQTDLTTGQTTPLVSLDALGIPTGPAGLKRDLSAAYESRMLDPAMFSWVGKMGLGGLDLATDGSTLYTVNLYDGQVYGIRLPDSDRPLSRSDVTRYDIKADACRGGTFRPFAVKYYQNTLYVGGVCDAAQSGQAGDLRGYVYALDPVANRSQRVLELALNYPRGSIEYGVGNWFAWTDDPKRVMLAEPAWWAVHPQPMLADLEFTAEGSLVLGLMDRLGHQMATGKGSADGQWAQTVSLAAGDVLRAAPRRKSFRLEANARAGEQRSAGFGNAQGPEGGEFYFQDEFVMDGVRYHHENGMGGLAMLPTQVAASSREPVADYNSAGVSLYDNQTGRFQGGGLVYRHNPALEVVARKTNHVGDVEVIRALPPTLVIPRLWQDYDGDGEQDADEPGLADRLVELWRGAEKLATRRTDSLGQAVFAGAELSRPLRPGQAYALRVPYAQPVGGGLQLTAPNSSGVDPRWNNDARDAGAYALIEARWPSAGQHQLELGAGFVCSDKPSARLVAHCSTTPGGDAQLELRLTQPSPALHYVIQGADTARGTASYSTAQPLPTSGVIYQTKLTQLTQYQFGLRLLAPGGCYQDTTLALNQSPGCSRLLAQLEQAGEAALVVAPNPTTGPVTLDYRASQNSPAVELSVRTLAGTLLLRQRLVPLEGHCQTRIDLSTYPSGTYLLTIADGERQLTRQLIKH